MNDKYDDIIHLPHHVSATHSHMTAIERAAQFSPFAALTGHGAAIKETARLTDEKIELDDYVKDDLSNRIQFISERVNQQLEVSITYFKPDELKNGGQYITATSTVKKIDEYERAIIMSDRTVIPIEDIISIEGEIFEQ